MADPLALVGVAEAQAQLRLDEDDAWLQGAIFAVSAAVVKWCGGDVTKLQAEDDTGVYTLWDVRRAVLVEIAYQYANREGPQAAYVQDWYANGYPLSAGCTALLQPYHKPVCA